MIDEAQLTEFVARISGFERDRLVKLFVKVRAEKLAMQKVWDAEEAQFKRILEACENQMLKGMIEAGETGFKTEFGTVYTAINTKVTIADDQAFFDFVLEKGDLGFFERRVSSTHVDSYMKENEGAAPPGLNLFRETVARVRKASEK